MGCLPSPAVALFLVLVPGRRCSWSRIFPTPLPAPFKCRQRDLHHLWFLRPCPSPPTTLNPALLARFYFSTAPAHHYTVALSPPLCPFCSSPFEALPSVLSTHHCLRRLGPLLLHSRSPHFLQTHFGHVRVRRILCLRRSWLRFCSVCFMHMLPLTLRGSISPFLLVDGVGCSSTLVPPALLPRYVSPTSLSSASESVSSHQSHLTRFSTCYLVVLSLFCTLSWRSKTLLSFSSLYRVGLCLSL